MARRGIQLRRNRINGRVLNWPGSPKNKVKLYLSRTRARGNLQGRNLAARGTRDNVVRQMKGKGFRSLRPPPGFGLRGPRRYISRPGGFPSAIPGQPNFLVRGQSGLVFRGAGAPRVEGRGEDPSKRAYRNSARYRERHGLAA